MTNDYNDLQILRSIKENVSQPSIAKEIGFSVGKVNFILKALVEKGLVKYERFTSSNNKMKYSYLLTDKGIKENISQPSIAKEIGFSVGKVNFILKALVEKGFIKYERFTSSNNKMKYKYLLTDEGIKEKMSLTQKFITRKKAEYEELQRELELDTKKWGGKLND